MLSITGDRDLSTQLLWRSATLLFLSHSGAWLILALLWSSVARAIARTSPLSTLALGLIVWFCMHAHALVDVSMGVVVCFLV